MNSQPDAASIEQLLHDVYTKSVDHDFHAALDVLEVVRSSDPENIYVAALRRQLQALSALSASDELHDIHQHELMEPMLGIIECAMRDHNRLCRSRNTNSQATHKPGQPTHANAVTGETPDAPQDNHLTSASDAQKELEALKLLYFQRASKFVMKGEYEQALAEVRRVFVVDPENTIAKQYATRVEVLLGQARRLASVPPDFLAEDLTTSDSNETVSKKSTTPKEPSRVHAARSTAWDDDFAEAKSASLIPEHHITPPSHRHTVSYGDSLAASLQHSGNQAHEDVKTDSKPPRKTRTFFLVSALGTVLIAGSTFAILSSSGKGTATREEFSQKAAGTMNSPTAIQGQSIAYSSENPTIEHTQASLSVSHQAPATAITPPSAGSQKGSPIPVAVESDPLSEAVNLDAMKDEPSKIVPPPAESKPMVTQPVTSTAIAFIPVEKDPQIIRLEKPQFPSFVWRTGIEGQVVVKVLIDPDGKPIDTQILKSTNTVFEQPVIDAVLKSQFCAAQMGQGPVTAWLTIPFKFKQPK